MKKNGKQKSIREFLSDENILHNDWYNTYKSVYTYHNSSKFTLKMGEFCWIWIIPEKNVKGF